ncbi:MAG: hypothetical protein MUF87_12815 [Anaerolineae bacterium]|jgi:hypothetical protein|nr:hypothetical protein [Anaerolineae bacterium]
MNDLITRYVHQVGLYVNPRERADIERELRSQIQDQLDDRYATTPTQQDIILVLKQLGDPRTIAASYGGEQYLIGPDLYPFLLTVLRIGLPLVPTAVVVTNFVGALLDPADSDWIALSISSIFTAIQAVLIFFAVVVLIFTILQQSGESLPKITETEFDPSKLPPADDPTAVDRVETGVGITLGTLICLAIAYWLQVGGLTLRFNLNDPGEVLPVPLIWLMVMLISGSGNVMLNLWALLHRHWTLTVWLMQTVLDLVGAIGLYFAILMPLVEWLTQTQPELATQFPLTQIAGSITLIMVLIMVLVNGSKWIRMWQYRQGTPR